MAETIVRANGIEIWTEDFGDPADPTILLIMGAGGQAILWPEELCTALVNGGTAGGRHVIRYDNRDVGQTTSHAEFSAHPYTIGDMACDAVAVLDAYGVERAHIVGASMGGMIAQTVALEYSERVLSMTSIMSTPLGAGVMAAMMGTGDGSDGSDGSGAAAPSLPGPEQKVLDLMGLMAEPPAS